MPFSVPTSIIILFVATVLLSGYCFLRSIQNPTLKQAFVILSTIWLLLQTLIAYSGFYTTTTTLPPRAMLNIIPPLLFMIWVFWKRQEWLNMSLQWLTYLSAVRIFVEIVLHQLYKAQAVPQIMTFEGKNFDILIGISSLVVARYAFASSTPNWRLLLAWHITGLIFLLNIVLIAILSVPSPFQQFGAEQPNIAILYPPFNLLPAYIVPLVLYSHLISIWQLLSQK
ncbi:MAG TPA: hypothetical protein PK230_05115 [Chitinophagales bacterium]|nr:hypothetical protein [Chitinophagales bacterium]